MSTAASKASKAAAWPLLRRFLPHLRPYRGRLILAALLLLLEVPLTALPPWIAGRFFDDALPQQDLGLAIRFCLLIVGISLVSECVSTGFGALMASARLGFSHRLRVLILARLQQLPASYFSDKDTGYLMARATEDAADLEELFTDSSLRAVADLIRAVVFISLLLYIDAILALTAFAIVVLIAATSAVLAPVLRRSGAALRERSAETSAALHDALSGQALVRAVSGEGRVRSRFGDALKKQLRQQFRQQVLGLVAARSSRFGTGIGVGVALLVGVWRILADALSVGRLISFFFYIGRLFDAVNNLGAVNPTFQRAVTAAARLGEIFDIEPEIRDRPTALNRRITQGRISFEATSFAYRPELPVLKGITFTAEPGSMVALVGPSGAGKSTLVSLIPRLYDPTSGVVTIDGVDLRDYRLRDLRRQIALVPQEIFLLNASVRDNLTFGLEPTRRVTESELEQAARAARAHDFILALPQGYSTQIGERGVRLSGGERQRLALAREILRDPRVLILDEATSHLDAESERLVQGALDDLRKNRTTLVIAHRLSTILSADLILVLVDGQIIDRGRHSELLISSPTYRNLYLTQFNTKQEAQDAAVAVC